MAFINIRSCMYIYIIYFYNLIANHFGDKGLNAICDNVEGIRKLTDLDVSCIYIYN